MPEELFNVSWYWLFSIQAEDEWSAAAAAAADDDEDGMIERFGSLFKLLLSNSLLFAQH